jgi:hypothetical protein
MLGATFCNARIEGAHHGMHSLGPGYSEHLPSTRTRHPIAAVDHCEAVTGGCSRGLCTSAAGRGVSCYGRITSWVVPTRQGRHGLQHDLPSGFALKPYARRRRARDVAAQFLLRLALVRTIADCGVLRFGSAPTACRLKPCASAQNF